MSEQNPPGDQPTQAYTAFNDDDATRLERSIPAYEDGREVPSLYAQEPYGAHATVVADRGPGIVAPLVTVALLSILIGIGIGYLLFHNTTANNKGAATTTTTSVPAVVSTTSSVPATTSTMARSTSTTARSSSTSTSTKATTTTTVVKSTSTTAKATTPTT